MGSRDQYHCKFVIKVTGVERKPTSLRRRRPMEGLSLSSSDGVLGWGLVIHARPKVQLLGGSAVYADQYFRGSSREHRDTGH